MTATGTQTNGKEAKEKDRIAANKAVIDSQREANKTEDAPVLNDSKTLRAEIAKIGRANQKLKEDRTSINADIQSNLEKLVAKGIPKSALKRAISDTQLDETQIENLDLAYQVCRSALGKPIQQSLLPDNKTH